MLKRLILTNTAWAYEAYSVFWTEHLYQFLLKTSYHETLYHCVIAYGWEAISLLGRQSQWPDAVLYQNRNTWRFSLFNFQVGPKFLITSLNIELLLVQNSGFCMYFLYFGGCCLWLENMNFWLQKCFSLSEHHSQKFELGDLMSLYFFYVYFVFRRLWDATLQCMLVDTWIA